MELTDKVWIPSMADMLNSDYGYDTEYFGDDILRMAMPTDFAHAMGAEVNSVGAGWWLRDILWDLNANTVNYYGNVHPEQGATVSSTQIGIRLMARVEKNSPYIFDAYETAEQYYENNNMNYYENDEKNGGSKLKHYTHNLFKLANNNEMDNLNVIIYYGIIIILFLIMIFILHKWFHKDYLVLVIKNIKNFAEKKTYYFVRKDIENICHGIVGDSTIHMSYMTSDVISINDEMKEVVIHFYEDEFVDSLRLPLSDGNWKLLKTDDSIPCVIGPNNYGIKTGDYIKTDSINTKFRVVGVLTDITYEPKLSGWGSNVKELFYNYDVRNEDNLFMITKVSVADELEDIMLPDYNVFIDYEKGLKDSEIRKNNSILVNKGQIVTYKKIREKSKLYIYKDINELLPVMIGAIIVICIGIVSAVSVSTESQFNNYKVFYLCGCTRQKCVLINVLSTNITIFLSVLLSYASILLYGIMSNATSLSIIINKNNILISMGIILIFEAMACIIPQVLIGKKSIKELLYE